MLFQEYTPKQQRNRAKRATILFKVLAYKLCSLLEVWAVVGSCVLVIYCILFYLLLCQRLSVVSLILALLLLLLLFSLSPSPLSLFSSTSTSSSLCWWLLFYGLGCFHSLVFTFLAFLLSSPFTPMLICICIICRSTSLTIMITKSCNST